MGTWGAFFTYTVHVNRLYWQPLSLMTWSTSVFSHPNETRIKIYWNNTNSNTKLNVQTAMAQNTRQFSFKGCTVSLHSKTRQTTALFNWECNNVAQQDKRKCCPYYLTLKIMSKLHVLLSNWNLRNSKTLSPLFFSFKIAINGKGETTTISMMTIMTIISLFDRPRSHSGLFYQRNLQSQCTLYLPDILTPCRYIGRILPCYGICSCCRNRVFSVLHSSTSTKQEARQFSLPFF